MKKIIRLTESDLARIVRRVISEQPTKIKTGESLDDEALLKMACTTWSRYSSEDKKNAKIWSQNLTNGAPFNLDTICNKSSAVDAIKSNNDRTILKGIIELNWM